MNTIDAKLLAKMFLAGAKHLPVQGNGNRQFVAPVGESFCEGVEWRRYHTIAGRAGEPDINSDNE